MLSDYETGDADARRKLTRELWDGGSVTNRKYFSLYGGTARPNYLAFHTLRRQMKLYQSLGDSEAAFRRLVYAWLDRSPLQMEENHPIAQFCAPRLGNRLGGEEVAQLRKLLLEEVDNQIRLGRQISRSRKDRNDQYGALNGMLEKLDCGYRLKKEYELIPCEEE